MKDLNSGQAWAVARHDAVGDISVSPDGAQLLIMADEKAPTRLNSVYTETIWVINRDGSAKRLTALEPSNPKP